MSKTLRERLREEAEWYNIHQGLGFSDEDVRKQQETRELLLEAESQLSALEADAQRWIPITERLPAVGQLVLVSYFTWKDSTKPRGYMVGMRDEFNNWRPAVPLEELDNLYPPTHWQPFKDPDAALSVGQQPPEA